MTTLDMFSSIENLLSKLISRKNNKETLISESLGIPWHISTTPFINTTNRFDFHRIFDDPNIGFVTCGMSWKRIKMKMWKLVSYFT